PRGRGRRLSRRDRRGHCCRGDGPPRRWPARHRGGRGRAAPPARRRRGPGGRWTPRGRTSPPGRPRERRFCCGKTMTKGTSFSAQPIPDGLTQLAGDTADNPRRRLPRPGPPAPARRWDPVGAPHTYRVGERVVNGSDQGKGKHVPTTAAGRPSPAEGGAVVGRPNSYRFGKRLVNGFPWDFQERVSKEGGWVVNRGLRRPPPKPNGSAGGRVNRSRRNPRRARRVRMPATVNEAAPASQAPWNPSDSTTVPNPTGPSAPPTNAPACTTDEARVGVSRPSCATAYR